jgi:hypothetical protein
MATLGYRPSGHCPDPSPSRNPLVDAKFLTTPMQLNFNLFVHYHFTPVTVPTRPPPTPMTLSLSSIGGLLLPFLHPASIRPLQRTCRALRYVSHYGSTGERGSLSYGRTRRRCIGFGQPSLSRSASHDTVAPALIGHFIWPWLTGHERHALAIAIPPIEPYAALRLRLPWAQIHLLRLPRDHPDHAALSLHQRTQLLGLALLALDFNYGDLIRWLGGEYTAAHRDWDTTFAALDNLRDLPTPEGYPPIDIDMGHRICTEGVPAAGVFECPRTDTYSRIHYDNHPPLDDNKDEVRAKFIQEERSSFHLFLPRFLAFFIFGLFISPISWILRKGKGRLVVDSSSPIDAQDQGAPNTYIPPPGTDGRLDENPRVYFGTALIRHLVQIWNIRIDFPLEEILQHIDDISSAFRRLIYHPDLAIVFAYVFMEFLIIPVGMIFGSRSSPSFWCILAEIRSRLADVANLRDFPAALAEKVSLPTPPTATEIASFVPAIADACHQGVPAYRRLWHHNSMFVDDNGVVGLRERILEAVRNSVASAYLIFGVPEDDRRGGCFALDKWAEEISHHALYLGYDVCTRSLTIGWPVPKRKQLLELLLAFLPNAREKHARRHPRAIASVLGLLRNAGFVAPLCLYLSLRLQHWFNSMMSQYSKKIASKHWWRNGLLKIPSSINADVQLMCQNISLDPDDSNWRRYIGYIVDRSPNCEAIQDAAHEGLGGWSSHFKFMWRITYDELRLPPCSWPMKVFDADLLDAPIDATGLHINILEFLAIILNLWFVLWATRALGAPLGGWILSLRTDNTSALSWLQHSARARNPIVRRLSRFLIQMLLQARFPGKISSSHIPGKENDEADCVSRPMSRAPTWASVIEQCCRLRSCKAYRPPLPLLCAISTLLSPRRSEVVSATEMTELLSLEPTILFDGSTTATSPDRTSSPC